MNPRWTRWTPHSLSGPGSALWTATVTWRRLSMRYITCVRIKMIRLVYKIPKPTMDFIHIQNCFMVMKKKNHTKTSVFFKSIHQNIWSIWSFDYVSWVPFFLFTSFYFSLPKHICPAADHSLLSSTQNEPPTPSSLWHLLLRCDLRSQRQQSLGLLQIFTPLLFTWQISVVFKQAIVICMFSYFVGVILSEICLFF